MHVSLTRKGVPYSVVGHAGKAADSTVGRQVLKERTGFGANRKEFDLRSITLGSKSKGFVTNRKDNDESVQEADWSV
ncbi:hypothetical protein DFP97_111163 [Paenibacillus prosopidis]|uniref:Uncharacterized protein n=1 Tax=Paenibacillus prosopidis TaxID=630520 RepID=A0A368VT43_9BACL|nr:hypothetical protein DFP97_111163 [Paenibacillus prosopidis]